MAGDCWAPWSTTVILAWAPWCVPAIPAWGPWSVPAIPAWEAETERFQVLG